MKLIVICVEKRQEACEAYRGRKTTYRLEAKTPFEMAVEIVERSPGDVYGFEVGIWYAVSFDAGNEEGQGVLMHAEPRTSPACEHGIPLA